MKTKLFVSLIMMTVFGLSITAGDKKMKSITMHDLMEDHFEDAEKAFKRKKDKTKLEALLKILPDLAPEDDKKEWTAIVNTHLESGELLKSCKACHSKFKKSYKKSYKKRLVEVPEDLLE
ncbi:MAG TPA: hypothetical protein PL048_03125 [Leptospiraceae bacterium]|nr:hypothetical protein [Leptospiraceae bacterium]HMY65758.1 hypothetical protein [Leptospiraceae bacterium]HMZ57740.1 hypothetical protein [Leptospiraceae bacterium]HNI27840.1 hypothetical protein [Leptospiraceae bacterium]HNI98720.1 hypothetical protein [Leptospiraceae bacterium]